MENKTIPESLYYNTETIPDDNSKMINNETVAFNQKAEVRENSNEENQSPLVGFLVSYSKISSGEFWPIFEGNRNTIGSSKDSKIQLIEATVSQNHAVINSRQSRNDDRLMIVISDSNSRNGILVNGKDIESQSCECQNFDKITIGNYELLLLIVDKEKYQLKQNPDFQEFFDYSSRKLY